MFENFYRSMAIMFHETIFGSPVITIIGLCFNLTGPKNIKNLGDTPQNDQKTGWSSLIKQQIWMSPSGISGSVWFSSWLLPISPQVLCIRAVAAVAAVRPRRGDPGYGVQEPWENPMIC